MNKQNSFIKREYDYAIRIAAYLASVYSNGHRSVNSISQDLFLTKPVTAKIVHILIKHGILTSVRGCKGGVKLSKAPNTLALMEILQAMGFNSTINECINNPAICPLVSHCKIHLYFDRLEQNMILNLKNTFVSEFVIIEDNLIKTGE